MSDGRWVWVPDGWRVVPEDPSESMCEAAWFEVDVNPDSPYPSLWCELKSAIAAAPAPPSGWHTDSRAIWGLGGDEVLVFCPHARRYSVTSERFHDDWWTPLPPGPEEEDKP